MWAKGEKVSHLQLQKTTIYCLVMDKSPLNSFILLLKMMIPKSVVWPCIVGSICHCRPSECKTFVGPTFLSDTKQKGPQSSWVPPHTPLLLDSDAHSTHTDSLSSATHPFLSAARHNCKQTILLPLVKICFFTPNVMFFFFFCYYGHMRMCVYLYHYVFCVFLLIHFCLFLLGFMESKR